MERKKIEVDDLIEMAKEHIQNEFEAKKQLLATIEKNSEKTLLELQQMQNDLKERENALVRREQQVKEQEKSSSVRNDIDGIVVVNEGAVGESSAKNFLEYMPVGEPDFMTWDKMIASKQEDMVNTHFLTI